MNRPVPWGARVALAVLIAGGSGPLVSQSLRADVRSQPLDGSERSKPVSVAPRLVGSRAAPVNDDCASATVISKGAYTGSTAEATQDGSASCGSSSGTSDVWFRYPASADENVGFDSAGSSYDAVISLHSGCPGTAANELACDGSGAGTTSRVWRAMGAGEEVWVRVSGFGGATGGFQLNVYETGSVSGTLTDAATATPLVSGMVHLYDASRESIGGTVIETDGSYTMDGLATGTYYARAQTPAHVDELYDGVACPFSCDPTTGTPITVTAGSETAGVDFELQAGGTIRGTVTDATTAAPLADVTVTLYDGAGAQLTSYRNGSDGTYWIGGLPTGTYYAVAWSSTHLDELYDDVACPLGCDPTSGTAISVTVGLETTGISFALELGGSFAGTVTDGSTASPVTDARVHLYDGSGDWITTEWVGGDGTYRFGGLPSGSYYALASSPSHSDELYDDIPCPPGCDVTGGTAISVTVPAETTGIDFVLEQGGSLGGTVTDAGTAAPLAGVTVWIYDSGGDPVQWVSTAGDGSYSASALPTGTYYAHTVSSGHLDELYDDIDCLVGCDPTTGTPISVTAGSETTGVDFALEPGGSISGTVSDASANDTLEGVELFVYDSSYQSHWNTESAGDGTFWLGGLPSGTYYVKARSSTHLGELYDGIACPFQCDLSTGTAISVTAGSETANIDFLLEPGGTISGTVTDQASTAPLDGVELLVHDGSGIERRTVTTSGDGTYAVGGLPTGTYFVRASIPTHVDELYDDHPCGAGCDAKKGTGIPVVEGSETMGVSFVLTPAGVIAGSVAEAGSGTPLTGVPVTAYDASGRPVATGLSAGNGSYLVGGLASGDVYLVAGPTDSHAAQLFDRLPCGCNVFAGSTIPAVAGTTVTGPDFELWPLGVCAMPAELIVSSVAIDTMVEYAACGSLTVGPGFEVLDSGTAALRAGGTVSLGGLSVAGGLIVGSGAIFPPGSGTTVYSEDFDDGFALGWDTSNGPCDLWGLDSACVAPPSGGSTLAFTRAAPACEYDLGRTIPSGWVRSPLVDLSSASTGATLRITHSWSTEGGGDYDQMFVDVSSDGGGSWSSVWTTSSADSGGFVTQSLNVLPYASDRFRVRFVFDAVDSAYNQHGGWFIDRVEMTVE